MTLCVFNDVWLLTVGNKIRKNKAVLCATAFLTGDGEHNRQPQRQEHPWACETASAFYKFIFHFRGELFWCTDAQITAAQRAEIQTRKVEKVPFEIPVWKRNTTENLELHHTYNIFVCKDHHP